MNDTSNILKLKAIIRSLPPDMSEPEFLREFFGVEKRDEITRDIIWYSFFKGSKVKAAEEENANNALPQGVRTSYALVLFSNLSSLHSFLADFHRKTQVDKNGNKYQTMIEYAPVQRTPTCGFVCHQSWRNTNNANIAPHAGRMLQDDEDFLEYKTMLLSKEAEQKVGTSLCDQNEAKERVIDWLETKLRRSGTDLVSDLVENLANLWRAESVKESPSKGSKSSKKDAENKKSNAKQSAVKKKSRHKKNKKKNHGDMSKADDLQEAKNVTTSANAKVNTFKGYSASQTYRNPMIPPTERKSGFSESSFKVTKANSSLYST
ncbi:MFS transporter [Perkinsela sp. CCAP 1560/4]|nr:MFS transporter [Perkinsela sp. CCAP 1560/4]|eukprot:KNH07635.1 MFS transporter [Perkinsela sp. CCAP 1560/4]